MPVALRTILRQGHPVQPNALSCRFSTAPITTSQQNLMIVLPPKKTFRGSSSSTSTSTTASTTWEKPKEKHVVEPKQLTVKAPAPKKPNKPKKDDAPTLWNIGGTSKVYQESATMAWRNRNAKKKDRLKKF